MSKRTLILGLLVALVLVLAAVACGGDDDEDATGGETATETGTTAPSFNTLEEGALTVGSDIPFAPFEFREGGELTGFDVELVEEIAGRLNLTTDWRDTAFDTIFTQLAAGRYDLVASATTITPEREEQVNFTIPYYRAQQSLTVNSERTPDIQSVDDLGAGHTVAVQTGTTGEAWARENLEPNGVEVRSFPDAPDTYTALEGGNVTGVIFDEPASADEASKRPSLELVEVIDTDEDYGFAVDPQNEELLDAVNAALQAMIDDGTYQQIYDKYFPDAPAGSVAES
ncbi:MAG: basic amino acid ABC transporter substrate-binding protein [Thermoleophilia bacterium]|nr:basic amino acid ABC transporter substrate-binding protein [Thermoleophilia bacterium]